MPRTKRSQTAFNKSSADRALLLQKIEKRQAAILNDLDAEDLKLAIVEADHEQVMNIMRESMVRYLDVRLMDLDSFDSSLSSKARERPKLKRSMSDTDAGPLLLSSSKASYNGPSISSNSSGSTYRSGPRSAHANRVKASGSGPKTRRSRSLSRTNRPAFPVECGSARSTMRMTPNQKFVPITPITPKIRNYNVVPAIMRRPKQNEIAVSLQGSPLMVNAVITDGINANIPLSDGRVIALQPQNMRFSEIADITLGQDSLNDLQQLRDNLTKLCDNYISRQNNH